MTKLLDAGEMAEILGVSIDSVRTWAREGRIPSVKLGHKTRRFNLDAVMASLPDGSLPQPAAATSTR